MKKIPANKSKLVKLLKYVDGRWRVVDYGVRSKIAVYAKLGYLIEH